MPRAEMKRLYRSAALYSSLRRAGMPHRVAYGLTRLYHAGSVFVTVDEKMQPIEISAAWKNEWAITGIATDDSEGETKSFAPRHR